MSQAAWLRSRDLSSLAVGEESGDARCLLLAKFIRSIAPECAFNDKNRILGEKQQSGCQYYLYVSNGGLPSTDDVHVLQIFSTLGEFLQKFFSFILSTWGDTCWEGGKQ